MDWPVFFEKLGHVHSIHNKFDLALRVHINVPAVEDRIGKVIKKLRILDTDIKGRWSCLLIVSLTCLELSIFKPIF